MYWTGQRPSSPPLVTFAQAQAQLRIVTSDEQQYITDLIDACSEYAEQALDSSLLFRTITAVYNDGPPVFHPNGPGPGIDAWPQNWMQGNRYFLPRGPVLLGNVQSITDANGQSLAFTQDRQGLMDYAILKPSQNFTGPVTIVYTAGYGSTAAAVPSDICMAIRTHVATLFENRTSADEKAVLAVPHSLEAFYALRKRTPPVA